LKIKLIYLLNNKTQEMEEIHEKNNLLKKYENHKEVEYAEVTNLFCVKG